jgi:hypothetical protein
MMDGLAFLPVPDLTNAIHLLRKLQVAVMVVVNNRLEEFPVSILTFIWQERIHCSVCYIVEWNPDDVHDDLNATARMQKTEC